MNVLYDAGIFRLQKTGGINRYFREVISRLPSELRPFVYGGPPGTNCSSLGAHGVRVGVPPCASMIKKGLSAATALFDLAHPTYYHLEEPFDWLSIRCPVVLTVHDFVFARYGHLYAKSRRLLDDQAAAIRRADLILCVSEATRNDLLELHPDCCAPVHVTHLGVSLPEPSPLPVGIGSRSFILYVGSRSFYKNFPLAVEMISELRRRGLDIELVVAGPPWSAQELDLLRAHACGDFVRLVPNPADECLVGLYDKAHLLIYPSLYEGFGLPPLEAMSRGTPVLALNTSSLPEVVGGGGILVDPSMASASSLADAAQAIFQSAGLAASLGEAALAQSTKFSWEKTAQKTFAAYRMVGSEARHSLPATCPPA